jgi:hypothetical protein
VVEEVAVAVVDVCFVEVYQHCTETHVLMATVLILFSRNCRADSDCDIRCDWAPHSG